jgi:hypothetical protein
VNKNFILFFLIVFGVLMGIDKIKIKSSLSSSIKISNEEYFRHLFYHYRSDGEIKKSNVYLVEREELPFENKNILNVILRPLYNYAEFEFSSKDILLGKGYPNKGMSDLNYLDVLEDFNTRAKGVYEIDPIGFLESEVVSAEVFYDLPVERLDVSVEEIIRVLSLVRHRHKETRVYGEGTFLSRSKGFSLKIYDKKRECFKKFLGAKYKKLNLNTEDTLRVEVSGKSDPKSTGLRRKYFYNKKLRDLLNRETQYSIIMDFINELEMPKGRNG